MKGTIVSSHCEALEVLLEKYIACLCRRWKPGEPRGYLAKQDSGYRIPRIVGMATPG
jgi:hypothetical protein